MVLAKAALNSIHVYLFSIFKALVGVVGEIEKILRVLYRAKVT